MRHARRKKQKRKQLFQSTHPMRGATALTVRRLFNFQNFNPRTPCGVQPAAFFDLYSIGVFQSTHPMRGATAVRSMGSRRGWNFNPRTPCGVRHYICDPENEDSDISIHAPHAGCDTIIFHFCRFLRISIHAPHAGCDISSVGFAKTINYFNPRTPCGVRPGGRYQGAAVGRFQSTHPMRGATRGPRQV